MTTIIVAALTAVLSAGYLSGAANAQDPNSGYATYSNIQGGVCPGGSSSGLPGVSMNAAQFGGGAACGRCVQIQGTGSGAGQDPVSTAPYIAVVTNVCPPCAPGDIDLQESGSGKFGITWSFVACPGSGRKLIEQPEEVAEAAQGGDVAEVRVEVVPQHSAVLPGTAAEEGREAEAQPVVAKQTEAASQETASAAQDAVEAASPVLPAAQASVSRKLLRGL